MLDASAPPNPPPAPMKTLVLLLFSHAAVALLGFAAGIYVLPILTAPPPPSVLDIDAVVNRAQFKGEFRRDLKGSDALHWGEGIVLVSRDSVSLRGKIAPGPDYKLYLSPEFVETEADFARIKPKMVRVGDVKTFENFIVPIPTTVDPAMFTTAIVWCESFSQFITAAKYR
jgi:Electron transfer DM13